MELGDTHDWLMYRAQQDLQAIRPQYVLAPPQPIVFEPSPPEKPVRRKRKWHWARSFMGKWSRAVFYGEGGDEMEALMGYSMAEARAHIERQFKPGMTWNNFVGGKGFNNPRRKWCVDHIVPKRLYSADQKAECFALGNLRPLWWKENMLKSGQRTHLI